MSNGSEWLVPIKVCVKEKSVATFKVHFLTLLIPKCRFGKIHAKRVYFPQSPQTSEFDVCLWTLKVHFKSSKRKGEIFQWIKCDRLDLESGVTVTNVFSDCSFEQVGNENSGLIEPDLTCVSGYKCASNILKRMDFWWCSGFSLGFLRRRSGVRIPIRQS